MKKKPKESIYVRIRSRVDQWAHYLMAVLSATFLLMLFFSYGESIFYRICAFLLFMILLFVFPMYLKTEFVFEDSELVIRSGLFLRWRISYSVITKARKTTEMSISPAFSFYRIEFEWWEKEQRKRLLIAPEDRDLFQRMLFLKNPLIDIGDNQESIFDLSKKLHDAFEMNSNSKKVPNHYQEKRKTE